MAIDHNGLPSKVVIDKSGANNAGLENINILIFLSGLSCFIYILKVKYLNNIVEHDHRFIKKITKPMMGIKAFHCAIATLAVIKTAHMISKGQFVNNQLPAHQ
jgi:putative transposase